MDRLLFVDDEPFVLRALKRTFEMEGFEVATATRPADALALLRGGQEFQVIGSDYRMPDMNGAEFLMRARELAPQTYRILISAVEEFGAAVDAINRGEIHRLIPKPWDRDELLAIIRAATEDYHLRRRYQEMTALLHSKNAALEAVNRDLEHRVQEATGQVLGALVAALDQRFEQPADSRRAAAWARRLGEAARLPGPELIALERAALLHDVGKIGIPDSILHKEGPLDEGEWERLRRYPELGYRMLGALPLFHEARKLILLQQENWDGTGYPFGVPGEKQPFAARILHLVVAYSSLREARSWRPARSEAEARAEVLRCAGTHFDPEVVAQFDAIPHSEWEKAGEALAAEPAVELPLDELRRRALDGAL